MKTLLVLTDFSKNAAHAAEAATRFAEKLHASILLWNCSSKVPVIPAYLGGTLIARAVAGSAEGIEELSQMTIELEDLITSIGGDYRPQLHSRYCEGNFREELLRQLQGDMFEMVFVGAASGCAIDHVFTGDHIGQVIETANCPVLVVPSRASFYQMDKIVFATDFEPEDVEAIRYLTGLSLIAGFKIEVVHIIIRGEEGRVLSGKEAAFHKQLEELKSPAISYQQVSGREVVGRLNRFCKKTGADLLAITHHQYSFFKRLLTDSTTKKELAHQKIPLMVFPLREKQ